VALRRASNQGAPPSSYQHIDASSKLPILLLALVAA
jgi:hypothetical protein